jgi:osmotically-inducible protein OsmY
MHFLRLTAAALLTCGLAATYTFAADESKTDNKSVVAEAKDQTITRQIRKAIAEDSSLARSGNNVGVTTNGGTVLLRGTVTSEFAKAEIEKHAVTAAGAIDKVTSELKVVERK